jgi:hypothetical protein
MHEGFSDYFAATITDQSKIGPDSSGPAHGSGTAITRERIPPRSAAGIRPCR